MRHVSLAVPATDKRRRSWEGVRQILLFNFPKFLWAAAMVASSLMILEMVPLSTALRWTLIAAPGLATGWMLSTLAASHYVYDHYPMFSFAWLPPRVRDGVNRWVNIHAGFDQTSVPLREAFPNTIGTSVDIFDPAVMTERSIHRARAHYPKLPGTLAGAFDCLPIDNGELDAMFLLFAAHELRTPAERTALFKEVARGLAEEGVLVVVEHLRDGPNFLVFGPGAFHFHARRQWLRAGRAAGLTLEQELRLTAFARCLIWRKYT